MARASSSVPCDGCTLCCRKQKVFLFPDEDARGLETVPDVEVIKGVARHLRRLPVAENGDCAYLGPDGCTVYDQRPEVCRGFDCRAHYFLPAAQRSKREARFGPHDMAIVRRGRQLVEDAK